MLRRRDFTAELSERGMRLLLGAVDVVRWPFERFAWLLERRLIWPLRERVAGEGPPGSVIGATALAALAAVAVAVGVLWPSGGNGSGEKVAVAPTPQAVADPGTKPKAEESKGPVLQGVPPSFGVGKGVGVAKAASDAASSPATATPAPAPEADAGATQPEDGAATTSSAEPVPAGPEAMKVARRFSQAFVLYEVGEHPGRAKAVFDETATPDLATALVERPPRLPQGTKVPKARVVNLVPGPRAGKAYTVSVSLLRVGLTSELRLTLQRDDKDGEWSIADILG